MRYLIVIACLATVLAAGLPAAALDCEAPELTLDRMDVIVRGKVLAIEDPGWIVQAKRRQVTLEVAKYYKGSGPRILVGYLGGIDNGNGSWMNSATVGEGILGAFRYEEKDLVSRPCNLWMVVTEDGFIPQQVAERLGPASDPEPGGPMAAPGTFPWWAVGLAAAGGAGVVMVWLWRRRRER